MQSEEVEAFLAVIRTGTISKAAEELFITQPTLSYRIHSLEKELGCQLITTCRGQKKIEPTQFGRQFHAIAEKMSQLYSESKRLHYSDKDPLFRVAATYTLDSYIMPSIYSAFVAQNYPVQLELHAMHYPECYRSVENHSIDVAFLSRIFQSDRVAATYICSDRMVLVCNRALGYENGIATTEIDANKGIYLAWNHELESWYDYKFGKTSFRLQSDNVSHIEKILEDQKYWAIVPSSTAKILSRNGNIRCITISDEPPEWPLYMLTVNPEDIYIRFLANQLKIAIEGRKTGRM